jgi:tRNA threonylcarbamoyladenosine biosynthesis protein TsaB
VTSLCVTRNGEVVQSLNDNHDENRSETLWVLIDRLLREAGLTIGDVDLFGVCVGPGGFTGLRVGMAAAKGLAVAAGKPLVGITSLEATAADAGAGTAVVALVNAYKGEVYSQLFSLDSEGAPVAENEALVSTFRVALDRVAHIETLVLVGDAAVEMAKLTSEMRSDDLSRSSGAWESRRSHSSRAEAIARLALLKYRKGEAGTAEDVAACYILRAEAEIKLAKGLLGSKIDRVRRQL